MKVVILAGGLGTRLAEETSVTPKPMVEIGGKPILWHILSIYSHGGFNEFVIALGYKGEVIKNYFINHRHISQNVSVNLETGEISPHGNGVKTWRVDMIDTGQETATGGRVLRLKKHLNNETFMLTYGDGLADIDIPALLAFHQSHGKLVTVSAVRPPARFGELIFDDSGIVREYVEKRQLGDGWINGGFMVCEPGIFSYLALKGDHASLETDALEHLAEDGQLMAYSGARFWQCMDTLRDKVLLEKLWNSGEARWKR
jgi:glucose-1-phosphate cytidylyltransferase